MTIPTHTISNGTITVSLPADMMWIDEYEFTPLRSKVTQTLDGGQILEQALQIKGRPLTLQGGENHGWITKAQLDALYTLASTADIITFTHADEREFTVSFLNTPLKARGVFPVSLPTANDYFIATVSLQIL